MHSIILQAVGNVPDFDPGPIYDIAYPLHSIMRYVVLILLLWAIVAANKGKKSEGSWITKVKKPAFYALMAIDAQLVLGIYLWIVRLLGDTQNLEKIKVIVKAPAERAVMVEHVFIMMIAIILIHVGYAKAKKSATDQLKSKRIFTFYTIGLIIILLGIVYIMQAAQRGLFPTM